MKIQGYIVDLSALFLLAVSFNFVVSKSILVTQMSMNDLKITNETYQKQREQLLLTEQHKRLGGEIVLTPDEQKVNAIFMKAKTDEIEGSLKGGKTFAPSRNFILSKPYIEASQVFQLITKMPKGGALHLHDCSMVDVNWLVKNATYRNNCYMCQDADYNVQFHFFQTPPPNPGCPWKLVSTERKNSGNATVFDQMLYKNMTLSEETVNQDINTVWKRFEFILDVANGLINYAPVFRDYYYEALDQFRRDNVQYIEVRVLMPPVYELNGTTHDRDWVMQLYKDTTDLFVQNNKDFTGAKIIKSNLKIESQAVILDDVKYSITLMQKFPDHFAGYDLVGQEGPSHPLMYYLDALLYPTQQSPPASLPYFLHAGETDWQGTVVDDNLLDAVLLNTSRIGHGYALPKHPQVMSIVKANSIAVEVNPISNQVLKLVDDLRNHPASVFIDNNFPVVISADDPAVWGAKGLSYDFYMAFMALAGEDADIKLLKQLAINSLGYSALAEPKKTAALKSWEKKWSDFIQGVLKQHALPSGFIPLIPVVG